MEYLLDAELFRFWFVIWWLASRSVLGPGSVGGLDLPPRSRGLCQSTRAKRLIEGLKIRDFVSSSSPGSFC